MWQADFLAGVIWCDSECVASSRRVQYRVAWIEKRNHSANSITPGGSQEKFTVDAWRYFVDLEQRLQDCVGTVSGSVVSRGRYVHCSRMRAPMMEDPIAPGVMSARHQGRSSPLRDATTIGIFGALAVGASCSLHHAGGGSSYPGLLIQIARRSRLVSCMSLARSRAYSTSSVEPVGTSRKALPLAGFVRPADSTEPTIGRPSTSAH